MSENATPADQGSAEIGFEHLRQAPKRDPYKLSGRLNWGRTTATLSVAVPVSIAIGAIYCIAVFHCPSAKLSALLVALGGAAVGGVSYLACRAGHVRHPIFAGLIAALLGTAALFGSWAAHMNYYVFQMANGPFQLIPPTPSELTGWAVWLFENGTWGLGGGVAVTGWSLVGFWVAEAAVVIATPAAITYPLIRKCMFCESCERWMRYDGDAISLPTRSSDAAIARLRRGELSAIIKLGVDEMQRERISMKLCVCQSCSDSRCVEINETTTKVVNGQKHDEEKRIAGPLSITSDEEHELRELAEELKLLSEELALARQMGETVTT